MCALLLGGRGLAEAVVMLDPSRPVDSARLNRFRSDFGPVGVL